MRKQPRALVRLATLAALSVALVLAAACTGDDGTPTASPTRTATASPPQVELTEARARWSAADTTDYRFTLQRSCECLPEWSAPTEVTVRDGLVVSATIEDGPAPEGAALTIEELFNAIADALDEPVPSAVTYDPELGYPIDVQLDLEAIAVDGGLSLTVSDLERLN